MTIIEMEDLEGMIDREGLPNVMAALARICSEKASHIAESYQDLPLAGKWDRCAIHIRAVKLAL